MSVSVLTHAHIIPRLRALLIAFICRAQDPSLSASKLRRLVGTIRRMTKAVISAEVAVYQFTLKADMLRDPEWRARVIAELGGWYGLRIWQTRYRASQMWQPDRPRRLRDTSAQKHVKKSISPTPKPQFRLAPLPRRFYGRAEHNGISKPYTPTPMTSPFDRPIALLPRELMRCRQEKTERRDNRSSRDSDNSQTAQKPPGEKPP